MRDDAKSESNHGDKKQKPLSFMERLGDRTPTLQMEIDNERLPAQMSSTICATAILNNQPAARLSARGMGPGTAGHTSIFSGIALRENRPVTPTKPVTPVTAAAPLFNAEAARAGSKVLQDADNVSQTSKFAPSVNSAFKPLRKSKLSGRDDNSTPKEKQRPVTS